MRELKYIVISLFFLTTHFFAVAQNFGGSVTRYKAEGNAVTGYNLPLYNNRPLYCNNTDAFILTGDKPFVRFVDAPYVFGSFMAGLVHNGKLKWFVDCSSIKMEYRGNNTTWVISDSAEDFPIVKMTVLPAADFIGLAIRITIENTIRNDELVWVYGGAHYKNNGWLSWDFDIAGNPQIGSLGFSEEESVGNLVDAGNGKFQIGPLIDTAKTKEGPYGIKAVNSDTAVIVEGLCSDNSGIEVMEAAEVNLINSEPNKSGYIKPVVRGFISLNDSGKTIYWLVKPVSGIKNDGLVSDPVLTWKKSLEKNQVLQNRIVVKTPDEKLNAVAAASAAAIDGVWYDSVFVHGGMLWNIPFPGWRTIFGGTMYGWHERVKKQAHYYISSQVKNSSKRFPKADTGLLLTLQHKDSRFYGKGYIDRDQFFYNFQSQFFDQLITAWRSTGDEELENLLFPALQLQLQWEEECFDPDGDGVYESYINTWPTDCQWYNGGATAEETSYAYKAHGAAAEMAMRMGDTVSSNFHFRKQQQIKKGFFSNLWIQSKGYSGAYKEQGGYQRLHEDPWLYSIFLPVDAKLVNTEQAIGSLYYTKHALQNDLMPAGGRKVWTSNWVPGIPTVRELYNGDNYHLALAYFLAGMPEDGYDIMKGTFYEGAFNGKVPGDLGVNNGGTDFNDCSSMFARVLVEGLFGYRPDYPNKKVVIAPQIPSEWNEASISTPDYSYSIAKTKNSIQVAISITKPATIDFYLPLTVTGIENVSVNNVSAKWELLPGFGTSILYLRINEAGKIAISITVKDTRPASKPISIKKNVEDKLVLKWEDAAITSVKDEQKVLTRINIRNGILFADITRNSGHHTILVYVITGKAREKRIVYLFITDRQKEQKEKLMKITSVPVNVKWNPVNVEASFNADVRTIFQQQYLSPRPNTVSARIGADGYSPWTFLFWNYKAPPVLLDSIQYLLKDNKYVVAKQGVPFYWSGFEKNIAFTSLWDNWPKKLTIPVNRKGKAVWLMVAGSTNPMQCNIANAAIIFNYADKSKDTLQLVPPTNYWSLCPYNIKSPSPGVVSRGDYTSQTDSFVVSGLWPEMIHLGQNCRAVLLSRRMKQDVQLDSITLQALSQEVVVGLMGITIMNTNK